MVLLLGEAAAIWARGLPQHRRESMDTRSVCLLGIDVHEEIHVVLLAAQKVELWWYLHRLSHRRNLLVRLKQLFQVLFQAHRSRSSWATVLTQGLTHILTLQRQREKAFARAWSYVWDGQSSPISTGSIASPCLFYRTAGSIRFCSCSCSCLDWLTTKFGRPVLGMGFAKRPSKFFQLSKPFVCRCQF
jgi:hypothetical protein